MRKRFRDYGCKVGELLTGQSNSITDVPGVKVGHVTLNAECGYGNHVCTGVTAILPHTGNLFEHKVTAASHVINGFGKTAGLVQVDELGEIESPILLTNTFGVPAATEGALCYMMAHNPSIGDTRSSLNVVVGECNDSYLNDMRGLHVRPQHAIAAIEQAHESSTAVEGCVGAGTGMRCFGWKGGIGSSSRQVELAGRTYHIGALLLTNFGDPHDLMVLGSPVGQHIQPQDATPEDAPDGSVIVVLATDLPIDAHILKRFAKRASFGLARTGSIAHNGSGDIVIAFSNAGASEIPDSGAQNAITRNDLRRALYEDGCISTCFRAVVEATEEAILNSLSMATTTQGKMGRVVPALPMDRIIPLLSPSLKCQ